MESKLATYTISILYLSLGLFLYTVVPRFNEIYAEMYSNWSTIKSITVAAFRYPPYYWLAIFGSLAVFVHLIRYSTRGKLLKRMNVAASLILVVLLGHSLDWLVGSTICHEWGCSYILPTWRWLSWLNI